MKKIELAKQTAIKAGKITRDRFDQIHPVKAIDKEGIHLEIDFEIEELIKQEILSVFPEHDFLGEEKGDHGEDNEYKWIVDPIDGTSNYFFHNPYHAISIALTRDGEVILGVVYEPMAEKLYWAEQGKGAFVNGKPMEYRTDVIKKIVMGGRTNDFRVKAIKEYTLDGNEYYNKMEMGSAALEVIGVAQGYLSAYLVKGIRLWDVAAANLILGEMGGKVVDFEGKSWNGQGEEMVAAMDEGILDKLLNKLEK